MAQPLSRAFAFSRLAGVRARGRCCSSLAPAGPDGEAAVAERRPSPAERLQQLDLAAFRPAVPTHGAVADFVPRARPLLLLARMGVDLHRIARRRPDVLTFAARADFERDLRPLLHFLGADAGLGPAEVAAAVAWNPELLLDGAEGRMRHMVHYLQGAGFERDQARAILADQPRLLTADPRQVDQLLGQLQARLLLTGSELRAMAVRAPRILLMPYEDVRRVEATLRRAMYLSRRQVHACVTAAPELLVRDPDTVLTNFALLCHEHGLAPAAVVVSPGALLAHPRRLSERMAFLRRSGRAQFDPARPLFTPLAVLAALTDRDFLAQLPGRAVGLDTYNAFLRSR